MDCSLPGSSIHGIFQARVLEWGAIAFSGHLPNLRMELGSPALQVDSLVKEYANQMECSCSVMSDYVRPCDCSPTGSFIHGVSPALLTLDMYKWTSLVAQTSCPTLCNPINGSLPGSAIPGILQARILESVAISFSNLQSPWPLLSYLNILPKPALLLLLLSDFSRVRLGVTNQTVLLHSSDNLVIYYVTKSELLIKRQKTLHNLPPCFLSSSFWTLAL
ncbi:hypothetical protein MG293_000915 [Ovis ammon polii]|uniref:Uncharacterized protein n=1 Tax=Ovis ammon polii TaxID=230172 RepID=A0AAD4UR45_OVIAM|nr:hypothetical protein MG293_000915 [Ovis ammon polii]